MNIQIELPEKPEQLTTYNDEYLAFLWHLAQHNPAPLEDEKAGQIVEYIGREIISRWLKNIPPALWNHQGKHHYWNILQQNGKWLPVNGDENKRQWQPNPPVDTINSKP
jgi:hypothetical protein